MDMTDLGKEEGGSKQRTFVKYLKSTFTSSFLFIIFRRGKFSYFCLKDPEQK